MGVREASLLSDWWALFFWSWYVVLVLFVSGGFVWFWKVGVSFKYVCIFGHTEFKGC
jgi:hypothetical protein